MLSSRYRDVSTTSHCEKGIFPTMAKRAPVELPENEGPYTRERLQVIALLVLTGIAICLALWVVSPFVPALSWALAFAVVAWPVHRWIRSRIKWPSIAAALSVLFVTVVLVVPAIFITQRVAHEVKDSFSEMKENGDPQGLLGKLEKAPKIGGAVRWAEENFNLREQTQKAAEAVSKKVPTLVVGSIYTLIQMGVALFTLFFLFRDRNLFLSKTSRVVPLAQDEMNRLVSRIGDTIYASIYGNVVVSVIQAVLCAGMFYFLGFKTAMLWGIVIFFLDLIPTLGAPVAWVPAAIYLATTGEVGKAAILTGWGVCVVGTIDNFLYPILTGKRMRMHTLAVFFAVIGGLMVFGASGLVLGPVVFAIAFALIDIWKRRTEDDQSAEEKLKAA
jgi:predicted PurR-regulated permease PerM